MTRLSKPLAAAALALLSAILIIAPNEAPTAAASGSLSISGVISIEPVPSGESEEPMECVVFLVPLDRSSGDSMRQWCSGYTFFNLTPGSYLVRAVPEAASGRWAAAWHGGTPYRSEATVVTVTDSAVTGVDIHLPRAGSITGQVSVDGPSPVDPIWVAAQLKDPKTGEFLDHDIAVVDPATGDYLLAGLPGGEYAVQVFDTGQPPAYADVFSGGADSLEMASLINVVPEGTADAGELVLSDPRRVSVQRVAGADRFEASAAMSQKGYEPGVPVVFVSNGLNWPDALSAGPAAAHLGGPLLLVTPDFLPSATRAELERLDPDTIIVTGGEKSISASVFNALGEYADTVERVGGADRYEVSRAIVRRAFGETVPSRRIYVVTGTRFPDALSAGAAAAAAGAPVLLVNGANDWVDEPTFELLSKTNFQSLTIVGGTASIGPTTQSMLRHFTTSSMVNRIGGVDRYETSRLLAAWSFTSWAPEASGNAMLATGEGFADALAGIPLADVESAPILLTPPACVPGGTLSTLRQLRTTDVTILGGPATLPPALETLPSC